jgi:glutathione S-transferase
MYQLHYFPSNANAAPHMVLEELGQKYDLILVDRAKNAQIWQYPERLTGTDAAATQIVKYGAEKRAVAYLDVIEQHLRLNGPLFLGETLSAADFYLIMLARWARPMANPPRSRPRIAKLLDMVSALPAVRRAYAREGVMGEIC